MYYHFRHLIYVKWRKSLIATIIVCFCISNSFCQLDSAKLALDSLLNKYKLKNPFKINCFNAEALVESENFVEAVKIYLELVEEQPDNHNINFKLGYCYLKTKLEKHKAIKYLEIAVTSVTDDYNTENLLETKAPYEAFFYLAKSYHINYQFDQAIDTLKYLKTIIHPDDKEFYVKIDRLIQSCEDAREISKTSLPIVLTNLGNGINSEYDEYSPSFPADESMLIFTSKRSGSTGGIINDDGKYFEDIYISYNKEGEWQPPVNIGSPINSEFNEASVSLAPDGETLFIYKADGLDGNIFTSKIDENGNWSEPLKMEAEINSSARETHASITSDGNTLFFVSDRKGGYGGTDIYYVKRLPTGRWSKPRNLGTEVNTPYNEESPHIMPDSRTLYFSSEGHQNMGGYDIFYSERKGLRRWSEAQNIGYPINTTEDDLFYVPTEDPRHAYYSTHNTGGLGMSDIYLITNPEIGEPQLSAIVGKVDLLDTGIVDVQIKVYSDLTDELQGVYTPNKTTGKYVFILPQGRNYNIFYEAQGYITFGKNFYVPEGTHHSDIQNTLTIKPITLVRHKDQMLKKEEPFIVHDLLFKFDAFDVDEDLDNLSNYLINNPNAIIEIGGHTDANGPDIYNMHLSLRRAIYVSDYLKSKGVNSKSLIVKGYGEKYPIAQNIADTDNPRTGPQSYNRRVEFKIIREGTKELIIKPIEIPKEYREK